MMTDATSTIRQVTDRLLREHAGYPLDDYLRDARELEGWSFARIADEIEADTDGIVTVSRHTVRNWWLQVIEQLDGAGSAGNPSPASPDPAPVERRLSPAEQRWQELKGTA